MANVAVIEVSGRRPIVVQTRKGFAGLTAMIGEARPDLPIRLGWQAKLAEWLPGRSGLRRR